jgi:hypothetical protein
MTAAKSSDQRDAKIMELSDENRRLTESSNRYIKSNQALAQKNARLSERILDAEDEIRRLVEERAAAVGRIPRWEDQTGATGDVVALREEFAQRLGEENGHA